MPDQLHANTVDHITVLYAMAQVDYGCPVLYYIVIPHLEIRACDWSKSRHVTGTKSH